jgi:hypothetical protein
MGLLRNVADVLNALGKRFALGDGGLEGIEVHAHQVDVLDAVIGARLLVGGVAADREETAVHLWVQRLDAPVHHLRVPGVICHVLDIAARIAQGLGSAASGQHLPSASQRHKSTSQPTSQTSGIEFGVAVARARRARVGNPAFAARGGASSRRGAHHCRAHGGAQRWPTKAGAS